MTDLIFPFPQGLETDRLKALLQPTWPNVTCVFLDGFLDVGASGLKEADRSTIQAAIDQSLTTSNGEKSKLDTLRPQVDQLRDKLRSDQDLTPQQLRRALRYLFWRTEGGDL